MFMLNIKMFNFFKFLVKLSYEPDSKLTISMTKVQIALEDDDDDDEISTENVLHSRCKTEKWQAG